MAREKFQTLTEQMFYVLLCLREECCGMDLMERIRLLTSGRVSVGPGTLYNLLEQFAAEGYIVETNARAAAAATFSPKKARSGCTARWTV